MVSIAILKKQIAIEKARERKLIEQENLEIEKIGLQKKLKVLKRSPGTKRNIRFLKRTGRGLKFLGKEAKNFAVKQAERIRKQQLRDEAELSRRQIRGGRKVSRGQKRQSKKIGKGLKIREFTDISGKKVFVLGSGSKKTRIKKRRRKQRIARVNENGGGVFDNLDF